MSTMAQLMLLLLNLQNEMDQLRTTANDLGRDSENITLERVVSSNF